MRTFAIGRVLPLVAAFCIALLLWVPRITGALEPDYRIGTDDVLEISVWDQKEFDQVVFVRPDGKISLPLVGEVHAGGRTVSELAETLAEMYGRTVRSARVMVGVKEIRSRSIFFVGGVARPGPLQLTQDRTLLQAISAAGGLVPAADLESAFVLRGDKTIPVDFGKLIKRGDVSNNLKLEPGDTVIVPIADLVYVQGEVKNPGPIKFTRDLTILKAIAQAGGLTTLAAPKRVTVLRGDSLKKETIRANVSDMMSEPENATDLTLKANDIITIPQRLF